MAKRNSNGMNNEIIVRSGALILTLVMLSLATFFILKTQSAQGAVVPTPIPTLSPINTLAPPVIPTPTPVPTPAPVEVVRIKLSDAGGTLRVRAQPSTDAQVLGTVEDGDVLPYVGVSGEWYSVTFNGATGYILDDYGVRETIYPTPSPALSPTPTPSPAS
jgi:uncharacterized protein YgiM (DUF1202 family)